MSFDKKIVRKSYDRGETRTRNLWIATVIHYSFKIPPHRSPAPYPLGHTTGCNFYLMKLVDLEDWHFLYLRIHHLSIPINYLPLNCVHLSNWLIKYFTNQKRIWKKTHVLHIKIWQFSVLSAGIPFGQHLAKAGDQLLQVVVERISQQSHEWNSFSLKALN